LAKLKQLFLPGKPIPLGILLLGLLIVIDGFFTATSSTVVTWTGTTTEYPLVYQGVLKILIGVVVTVFGYLLFHGKIRYFSTA